MQIRQAVVVIGMMVTLTAQAGTFYDLNRRASWLRKGMTPAEVRDVMEEGPYVGRLFSRDGANILEWSYPIDQKTWIKITFRDGKIDSQEKIKGPGVRRRPTDPAADPDKRAKLGMVHLGMNVDSLEALAVTPDITLTGDELKAMNDVIAQAQSTAKDLFGLSIWAQTTDLTAYDQLRMFELTGETFYVAIKDSVVAEMGTSFDPVAEDIEREFIKALATRKPTAEAIRTITPGMKEEEVILLLGIPKRQRSVRTVEGEVTILTYLLSPREACEIDIRDGVVTRITTDVRF